MYEQDLPIGAIIVYFLEIVVFFIAITIPFDIRDYFVDSANKVETLPTLLGRRRSTRLALFLVFVTFLLDLVLTYFYALGMIGFLCMTFTTIFTAKIIHMIQNKESDYYFSGLMDTAIMFPYSIYVLFQYFI